jgi:hypothetical protein
MTMSQSGKTFRDANFLVPAALALAALAFVPMLFWNGVSLAVFSLVGFLAFSRMRPNADTTEKLASGALLGLTVPAFLVYLLNMSLKVRISIYLVAGILASLVVVSHLMAGGAQAKEPARRGRGKCA